MSVMISKIKKMSLDKTKVPTTLAIVIELIEGIEAVNSNITLLESTIEGLVSDILLIKKRLTDLEKV